MSELYSGCWHKLDWAKRHVDEFQRSVDAWGANFHGKPPFEFRKEFDSDSNCFTLFTTDVADAPPEWSLIIGDALTNFRAALDYLAHDLVGRGSQPQLRGTSTPQFVIARESKDFPGALKGRMPGIQSAHATIVEYYQPYRWLDVKELHPFFLLDHLVRWDKHRQIQPVFAQHAGSVSMGVTGNSDFRVTRTEPGLAYKTFPLAPRLEADAELLRVFGERTGPNPDVKVRYEGAVAVTFEDGRWARDTLDQVGAMIAQLFTEIELAL